MLEAGSSKSVVSEGESSRYTRQTMTSFFSRRMMQLFLSLFSRTVSTCFCVARFSCSMNISAALPLDARCRESDFADRFDVTDSAGEISERRF